MFQFSHIWQWSEMVGVEICGGEMWRYFFLNSYVEENSFHRTKYSSFRKLNRKNLTYLLCTTLNCEETNMKQPNLSWHLLGPNNLNSSYIISMPMYEFSISDHGKEFFGGFKCLIGLAKYCKRTYYPGVIFTRICIFGSVRGHLIPRNRHTLNT